MGNCHVWWPICFGVRIFGIIQAVEFIKGDEMSKGKLEINCPCCKTKLTVDKKTGEVLWKEERQKEHQSFSDMLKGYENHKKESEGQFIKQNSLQKERTRLLDEMFNEAQKKVDKTSTDKPLRDFDLD